MVWISAQALGSSCVVSREGHSTVLSVFSLSLPANCFPPVTVLLAQEDAMLNLNGNVKELTSTKQRTLGRERSGILAGWKGRNAQNSLQSLRFHATGSTYLWGCIHTHHDFLLPLPWHEKVLTSLEIVKMLKNKTKRPYSLDFQDMIMSRSSYNTVKMQVWWNLNILHI